MPRRFLRRGFFVTPFVASSATKGVIVFRQPVVRQKSGTSIAKKGKLLDTYIIIYLYKCNSASEKSIAKAKSGGGSYA